MTTAGIQRGPGGGVTIVSSGSLEDTPLAEVIRRIVLEERSGELRVAAPPAVKTISFDRGFIVYASSNLESDGLGKLLIDSGRISKNELALVGMLTRTGKKSLRQSLVQGGIVSEEELGRYVAVQVNEIVLSLFSLVRGTYRFHEGPCTTPIDLMVSLSAHRILLEGIRRMSSGKLILGGLPALKSKVTLVDEPPFTLDVDKLRPMEKAVLRLAHHGLSIGRIVNTIGEDKGKTLRACYSLYGAGVLEPVTSDAPRPRPIQEETGSFLVSEILRKVQPVEDGASPPAAAAVTEAANAPVPAIPMSDEPHPSTEEPPPDELPTLAALEEQERQNQEAPEQQQASGGLSLLIAAVGALWSSLVGWFANAMAAFTTSRPTDQSAQVADTDEPKAGDFVSSEAEARVAELDRTSPAPESNEMAPTVAAVGVPSWSMMDTPSEEDSPPPTKETVDDGMGVPSWSMKDTPSEDVAKHAPSAFVEEPDYQHSVVEGLGVPKWSLKDAPEEESIPKRRKEPTHLEPEPPVSLGVEDEEPQAPVRSYQPDDSSPILEDDLVALEPEENPEHSMLDAIPLEEITREEESPELLIMIDEDAFADVPEFGQDVAALPHEEPSIHIETEVDETDQVAPDMEVTEVVEDDVPTFEREPAFEEQQVFAETSAPPMSIEGDEDDEDVEFDFEPVTAESQASSAEPSQVVARSAPVEAQARVSTPTSKASRVVAKTPSPAQAKAPVTKRTKKPSPPSKASRVVAKTPPPAQAKAPVAKRTKKPSPPSKASRVVAKTPSPTQTKAPVAERTKKPSPPAPERKAPPESTPPTRPAPIEPTGDGDVSASPPPQHSSRPSNEDVVGAEVRLLRDVKLHFKVRDWAGAVPLLERLVELSPGNALYRGMLGRAMTSRPELRNNAEKHFVEALRLSPQNPELHYWLGLYYKSFGLESRAFNEFRTTLRINPQHAGATKQMAAAGKRGTSGGMLKKLFG